jgi:predicted nucleotide-binding protein
MRREKTYLNVKFPVEILLGAASLIVTGQKSKFSLSSKPIIQRVVQIGPEERWDFESNEEFSIEYRKTSYSAFYAIQEGYETLEISFTGDRTQVNIRSSDRDFINAIAQKFEDAVETSMLPVKEGTKASPVIFIGHGRSPEWKDLKNHLHDQHGLTVEAYETGSRAGHTIRDILDDMLAKSSFALLVMTGEDTTEDGDLRARENVVHELGLFQGKLGFNRAIALLEHGTSEFSNLQGIQQIRFTKGNIREVFGDVLAVLRREFGAV